MTTPDRMALLAAQDAWAAGKAYRPEPATDTRDHSTEIRASHQGAPSIAQQNKANGAPAPAPDNGPDPGTVVG